MRFITKEQTICFFLLGLSAAGYGFRRQAAPQNPQIAAKSNPALNDALLDAIEKQSKPALNATGLPSETPEEIAAVKQLLEAGASADATPSPANARFYSPKAKAQICALILAVGWNHVQVVHLLIEHGANVNARDEWGGAALLCCTDEKSLAMARYLIAHGADVNAQQDDGLTPLHWAAMNRNLEYLRLLLDHHANPNVLEKRGGLSPLMSAASQGDVEAVKALLAHGADAALTTNNGTTAMLFAKVRGYDEIVKILIASHPKISLHEAARIDDVETVLAMLNDGAKADSLDAKGNPPIIGAVVMNCLNTARLLLERGADVNSRSTRNRRDLLNGQKQTLEPGPTALMTAAARNYPDMVKLLLTRGANVNAADGIRTALTAAVGAGNLEVVKILLRHKLDLTAHRQGARALGEAIKQAVFPRDLRLHRSEHRAKGQDARQEDENARNAVLDLMLKAPLKYKTDGGFALCAAASDANTAPLVKMLIQRGAPVNFRGDDGKTPLINAIEAEQIGVISLLIANGANVRAAAKDGTTPLEFAVAGNSSKIVALLKRAGAK